MKETEVIALLTKMAAYDQRTIGDADIAAWHEVLPDEVGLDDALAQVPKHYAKSRDRMSPPDVIEAVLTLRRERLRNAGTPPMPGYLTWQQEREWRQLWCDRVKVGMDRDMATESASMAMNLHPELPAVGSSDAQRAELAAVLAASKRVPNPRPQGHQRTEQ